MRVEVQGSLPEDAQIDADQFCGGQSVLFCMLKAVELETQRSGAIVHSHLLRHFLAVVDHKKRERTRRAMISAGYPSVGACDGTGG